MDRFSFIFISNSENLFLTLLANRATDMLLFICARHHFENIQIDQLETTISGNHIDAPQSVSPQGWCANFGSAAFSAISWIAIALLSNVFICNLAVHHMTLIDLMPPWSSLQHKTSRLARWPSWNRFLCQIWISENRCLSIRCAYCRIWWLIFALEKKHGN